MAVDQALYDEAVVTLGRTGLVELVILLLQRAGPAVAGLSGGRAGGGTGRRVGGSMSDTGELRTERLALQPLNMSDHSALLTHWTGRLVRRFLFDDHFLTTAEVTETIVTSQRSFAMAGFGLWALRPAARHAALDSSMLGTALLGTAGLRPLDDSEDTEIEIVYSLEPDRWGHGYAAEAAVAIMDYAFEILGLRRVIAEIDEGNAASEAVAQRLGMRPFETAPGLLGPMTHFAVEREGWLGPRREKTIRQ
jgi:RimJ/RimL family protein N-acetyltransferase